jgi:hypothetical protein
MTTFRRRLHDEDGVALVTALLAVVILSGLMIVFFSRAMTEIRVSGDARNFETAVHAAEAASDTQIRALNADDDHVTLDGDEPVALEELEEFDGTEREWVLQQLDRFRDVEGVWLETSRGEAFAFRPTEGGEPADVLYAAGAIPRFAVDDGDRVRVRVLKMQIAQDHWVPEFALMTEGDLGVGGSASIKVDGCDPSTPQSIQLTCIADVHTNGELTWTGQGADVEGQITVAGGECPSVNAIGGCLDSTDGVASKPVPPFQTRSFYRPPDEVTADPDDPPPGFNPDPAGDVMAWYDLCDDGRVRRPDPAGATPCTGDVIWPDDDTDSTSGFRGWEYGTKANNTGWHATSARAGVYYVYGADAYMSGTGNELRALTILVDDAGNGSGAGSLRITGNPRYRPAMEDVLFVADRDFSGQGTGQGSGSSSDPCEESFEDLQDYAGFIGAGEQIEVYGNMRLAGAIVAQDKAEEHSMVSESGVSGNMCLDYSHDLEVDLSGIWVITYWNEL